MLATRVKICGLTRADDVLEACRLGVDALGLVFYKPSRRYVDIASAAALSDIIPPFVQRVGLFVNPTAAEVNDVLAAVGIDLLQFHGDETAAFCESFKRPYIKAFAAQENVDLLAKMHAHPQARAFLIDTYKVGEPGGTGETFNWDLFPRESLRPLILAGGLHAENVTAAIAALAPYAVDVSGGVEASAGCKSAEKMAAFIRQVKFFEEQL
jgi:phosphoribosylanthranilate isomerase